jgi:acyl phosphate:glycerol-3-phosphate acyltransferase
LLTYLISIILGYAIGGFPTGIIFCRVIQGVDPRTVGSGSSGATNVSRILGKKWAAIVLLIDALKGFLPVRLLVPVFAGSDQIVMASLLMAIGIVVGHVWTPYAYFKGGKGVASAAGAMIALDPLAMLIALIVWGVVFALFRIVSLASMIAAISLPVAMIVLGERPLPYIGVGICLVLFLIFTHRSNIKRLLKKEEKPLV